MVTSKINLSGGILIYNLRNSFGVKALGDIFIFIDSSFEPRHAILPNPDRSHPAIYLAMFKSSFQLFDSVHICFKFTIVNYISKMIPFVKRM